MRASYCDGYYVPLPEGHPFPMAKFPALHRLLRREGLLGPTDVVAPRQADWTDLRRIHTSEYLTHLAEGTLPARAERRMGLPWSERLVYRSRLAHAPLGPSGKGALREMGQVLGGMDATEIGPVGLAGRNHVGRAE